MIDRRRFVARGAAGLAGILASRRAPALAQTVRLHLLHRVDFIPQGEAELKRQLADYGRQMKMEVVLETINENDLQTRITAAIQSAAGPDIVQMLHNWPHLYASELVDMTDLCEWKQRDQGRFYPQSEAATRDGSRWLGLPHCITPALINYRKSWFAEAGASAPRPGPWTSTGSSAPPSRRRASPSARRFVTPSTTRPAGRIR